MLRIHGDRDSLLAALTAHWADQQLQIPHVLKPVVQPIRSDFCQCVETSFSCTVGLAQSPSNLLWQSPNRFIGQLWECCALITCGARTLHV
jgi:hypothetical protein